MITKIIKTIFGSCNVEKKHASVFHYAISEKQPFLLDAPWEYLCETEAVNFNSKRKKEKIPVNICPASKGHKGRSTNLLPLFQVSPITIGTSLHIQTHFPSPLELTLRLHYSDYHHCILPQWNIRRNRLYFSR